MDKFTLYFDKQVHSIDGALTLQAYDPDTKKARTLFHRMAARSGQKGYEGTDWVRGKSPVPFGRHQIDLHSLKAGKWSDYDGIGEFFKIFTDSSNTRRIYDHKRNNYQRFDIGLHPENTKPGSAGCIVLLGRNPLERAQVEKLFAVLRGISDESPVIDLVVL